MDKKICIVGLGYVGLPLAVEFAKKYPTTGFDVDVERIREITQGRDSTLEISEHHLKDVIVLKNESTDRERKRGLSCTTLQADIASSNIYIITVPTPTDKNKRPVLEPLLSASQTIGEVLKKGDHVIYESTVYPGVTEDECVPVLEKASGLCFNDDFFCGYSPERINPGDKEKTVTKIQKITSGSTESAARFIDDLYKEIITAGTHLAPSIKVAEAAKVIENSQRDINIAFVNELAKIFHTLEIDTHAVLEAASTKWNFLPFKPGLVGGHCIGVDPYYLAQKAQESGYYPEIILAGRRINDSMGKFVATRISKLMHQKGIKAIGGKALILGFTFKPDCPDIRNTMVVDIYTNLKEFGLSVDIFDPWVNKKHAKSFYKINIESNETFLSNSFDIIVLAVDHEIFSTIDISALRARDSLVFDVKGFLPDTVVDARL